MNKDTEDYYFFTLSHFVDIYKAFGRDQIKHDPKKYFEVDLDGEADKDSC